MFRRPMRPSPALTCRPTWRASLVSLAVVTGCSGGPEGASEIESDTSPALPAEDTAEAPEVAPAPLTASPACGAPGTRVVLRLGLTSDGRVPECMRIDDFAVLFSRSQPTPVAVAGPTSDGYCALDVNVPKGAESGPITVAVGGAIFESTSAFEVHCR
jgi:hypothetical protein